MTWRFLVVSVHAYELCIFILLTSNSEEERLLSEVAAKTWMMREQDRARVYFVTSYPEAFPHLQNILRVPNDTDVPYNQLQQRVFRLWRYLGINSERFHCKWFLKSDIDTFVNLPAMLSRLKCFDWREYWYLGVLHVLAHNWDPYGHPPLVFAHGGCGYVVSVAVVRKPGFADLMSLGFDIAQEFSDAKYFVEDGQFAAHLRTFGVTPLALGTMDEVIANFHHVGSAVLQGQWAVNGALRVLPLHGCVLIAHPKRNILCFEPIHFISW